MTTAVFEKRFDGFCGVTVTGHSGFAPEGEDIVCAAVSSAAILFANTLLQKCGEAEVISDDGFLSVYVPRGLAVDQTAFEVFYSHLRSVAVQYPENLRIFLLTQQEEK